MSGDHCQAARLWSKCSWTMCFTLHPTITEADGADAKTSNKFSPLQYYAASACNVSCCVRLSRSNHHNHSIQFKLKAESEFLLGVPSISAFGLVKHRSLLVIWIQRVVHCSEGDAD